MSERPPLLGIDNVFFEVVELNAAIVFYERCGFKLKFRSEAKALAIFEIGRERPGLILKERQCHQSGRLWVEVKDAIAAARYFSDLGTSVTMVETTTGLTCEILDPSGNAIGFADYSRRSDLER